MSRKIMILSVFFVLFKTPNLKKKRKLFVKVGRYVYMTKKA
jgi:hypothetical protein